MQTDGLVERFHQTLITMLSMYIQKHGIGTGISISLICCTHMAKVSAQESTCESPFFLMFGRDPRQPSEETLRCPSSDYIVDLDDYNSELVYGLYDAWRVEKVNINSAESHKRAVYERRAKKPGYKVGDRVMVHMPHEATGKAAKLARPFFGPYRILSLTPTNAEVRLVDRPDDASLFVSLSRLRLCYAELSDTSCIGHTRKRKRNKIVKTIANVSSSEPYSGPSTRSRAANELSAQLLVLCNLRS